MIQPAFLPDARITMNHFLALRLADSPRERLRSLSERLQSWNLPASWVHPEDYHLTVLFLGALDAQESDTVPLAVELLAAALRRPALRLCGLGAAGGRREPRVVYAAVEDAAGALADLHHDLCDATGITAERAFLPHVTLCRPRPPGRAEVAGPAHGDWPELLAAHGEADWGLCETTDLVLYQTQAGRTPRYQIRASWPLPD